MTHDSPPRSGQAYLTDAFLWLVGAPLALLDLLYLIHLAPPLSHTAPETLVVWILGIVALVLLLWSLLCSACAHLALLRFAPPLLRRTARALVHRCGTRLSRSLLAKAGASALIGSALMTAPIAPSVAAPSEGNTAGISLTWADEPGGSPSGNQQEQPAPTLHPELGAPSEDSTGPTPPGAPALPSQVTVAPGDSLWSIAAALRTGADDAQITKTWRAIYAANADTIADPSLIHPGQRLTIPQDLP